MIGLAAGTRIWIVAGVTDMRRGFTGLSGMVQTALQENPFSGQVFFFVVGVRIWSRFCGSMVTGCVCLQKDWREEDLSGRKRRVEQCP
jgi:transposase